MASSGSLKFVVDISYDKVIACNHKCDIQPHWIIARARLGIVMAVTINNFQIITETSPYKVTPDFHLTYSKNGENLGSESK